METDVNNMNPLVSVLMPVYNGELYLRDAIQSILQQTYSDFEFIIINDGSIDGSEEIILNYNDERIVYIKNEQNIGLIRSLNKGIELAKGKYIARMDCDDISLPFRFEKQVEFMENNPDIGVCGTQFSALQNKRLIRKKVPCSNEIIKSKLLFGCPIAHPSVMIRTEILKKYNLRYSTHFPSSEDYQLWISMASFTNFANLPDVLLHYRIHKQQITQRLVEEKDHSKVNNILSYFAHIGLEISTEELEIHTLLSAGKSKGSIDFLKKVNDWFVKIEEANNNHEKLDKNSLKEVLEEYWGKACSNSGLGFRVWRIYNASPYAIKSVTLKKLRLLAKIMLKHKQY